MSMEHFSTVSRVDPAPQVLSKSYFSDGRKRPQLLTFVDTLMRRYVCSVTVLSELGHRFCQNREEMALLDCMVHCQV